jgi:hypothetical protein
MFNIYSIEWDNNLKYILDSFVNNFRNGYAILIKDTYALNLLVKQFMDYLFNTYLEEMIFSIYSLYYKKVGDYNIANYKYRYLTFSDRDDITYLKDQGGPPLKCFKAELKTEAIIINIQNDLTLMSVFFKGLESELNRIVSIEIGENYLEVFIDRIECIRVLTFCSQDEMVNTIASYKEKFTGIDGAVLLETLLLIRDDIKKNKKDWHKYYVKNYRNN